MNEKLQKLIKETKDDTKIILASMVIPFLYMLLSLIEYTLTYPFNDPTHHPILITEYFAIPVLIFFLPAILLSFYIIPPLVKRVKLKKFFQYFTLSSWTFVFVFWFISGIIYSIKVH